MNVSDDISEGTKHLKFLEGSTEELSLPKKTETNFHPVKNTKIQSQSPRTKIIRAYS
jgi:hypothetical protein